MYGGATASAAGVGVGVGATAAWGTGVGVTSGSTLPIVKTDGAEYPFSCSEFVCRARAV